MSIRLIFALALAGLLASFAAVAGDALTIVDIKSPKITIFDEKGNFKEERTKQDFLKIYDAKPLAIPVLKVNTMGLLQIQYGKDKENMWIGEEDVKLSKQKSSTIECVPVVHVKTPDPVAAAAMGVGGCSK